MLKMNRISLILRFLFLFDYFMFIHHIKGKSPMGINAH